MRKLVLVVAAGLAVLGVLALMPAPANAELKVGITGNIRLTGIYSSTIPTNSGGSTAQEIFPSSVPYTAGPGKSKAQDNSQFTLDARRTRLQVVVSDEVGMTKLSAFYQTDFDTSDGTSSNSNSRVMRMRLAWAQAQTPTGWILRFGQIRSTLSEFGDNLFGGVAAPDLVDEFGHWDQISLRTPAIQAAYGTKMMGGDLLVGGSIERGATVVKSRTTTGNNNLTAVGTTPTGGPGLFGVNNPAVQEVQGQGETVPLFAAAARYRTPLWAVFLRGGAQQNRVIFNPDPATPPLIGPKQGEARGLMGWMSGISAEVTPGPLTVYGQYWYSDGLNRINSTIPDVAVPATPSPGNTSQTPQFANHILNIATHNWHAGAEYKLTKDLKFVAVYEWLNAVANRKIFNQTPTSTDQRSFQAVHAGFSYTFWTRFNFGAEYQWGRVHSFGVSQGDIGAFNTRLHFYF